MAQDAFKNHIVYETLFENSYSVMLIIDSATGDLFDANKAALKFYQYSKEELVGLNISQIMRLSDKVIKKELKNTKLLKRNIFTDCHQLKNGEFRDVEIYCGPMEFADKNAIYCIVHDISKREQAMEELKKSESTIRAMINATDSLVYLFDIKGNIINLNTSGAQLFDKSPKEMIGKNFNLFFDENNFSRLRLLVDKVAKTHNPVTYQKDRDGKYYSVHLYPIFNKINHVNRICAFINDITDLKKTEKVFAAIETAGGICHEMNQPLQVILGNLELLKLNTREDDPNRKLINIILSQTEKIGVITQKLTHITRYETKGYIKGTIFDIDRSSEIK